MAAAIIWTLFGPWMDLLRSNFPRADLLIIERNFRDAESEIYRDLDGWRAGAW